MTFGEAIEQMEKDRIVSRRAWPEFAKNIGVCLLKIAGQPSLVIIKDGRSTAEYGPVWHPSHSDLLARDWEVIELLRARSKSGGA